MFGGNDASSYLPSIFKCDRVHSSVYLLESLHFRYLID